MCGRFVSPEEEAIRLEYGIESDLSGDDAAATPLSRFPPNFNAAPTQPVPVVRVIRGAKGKRESMLMRWGLVPAWAFGEPPSYSTINATIERLETAPAWRGAWTRGQRCIMPCVGFYEWHVNEGGGKTPYFISPVEEGATFAFAALWDESMNPVGESTLSCAVITMPANDLMARIHNSQRRMPAILAKEDIDTWLNGTAAQAKALLKQFPDEQMRAWAVSRRVNSPRENGPDLIQPLEPEL